MKDVKISIEEQSKLFKKHLDEVDNERIIFSAPFGAGKTYFLREFFQDNSVDYLTIKLAPVNYSVASNEDIFRLIKFDILFELLAHHGVEQPGKVHIRPDIFYGFKLAEKAVPFFTSIATFWGTLNKDVKEATDVMIALETIRAQVTEVTSISPEVEENPAISAFLKQMMEAYNREADDVTAFIEAILTQLATKQVVGEEERSARAKVLVIDDMDRLDPEHIFRLFNVFSAHFDYNQASSNKFGFDRVIFVCDIRNIRNIFHSRYGSTTDFSGYIDKFFSQEIFFFNNEKAIKNYVDNLLKSIRLEEKNDFTANYFTTNILQGANYTEKGLAFWVLFELIASGSLKPRRLYSPHKAWAYPKEQITVRRADGYPRKAHLNQLPTILALQLLSSIAGGGDQLLNAAKHTAGQPRSEEFMDLLERSGYLERLTSKLLVVDYYNHKFQPNDNSTGQMQLHTYTHPDGRQLTYVIGLDGNRREIYDARIEQNSDNIQFFELLPVMIQRLLDEKLI